MERSNETSIEDLLKVFARGRYIIISSVLAGLAIGLISAALSHRIFRCEAIVLLPRIERQDVNYVYIDSVLSLTETREVLASLWQRARLGQQLPGFDPAAARWLAGFSVEPVWGSQKMMRLVITATGEPANAVKLSTMMLALLNGDPFVRGKIERGEEHLASDVAATASALQRLQQATLRNQPGSIVAASELSCRSQGFSSSSALPYRYLCPPIASDLPVKPQPRRSISLGGAIGLLFGILLTFTWDAFVARRRLA